MIASQFALFKRGANAYGLHRRGVRVCTGTGLGAALSTCLQSPDWSASLFHIGTFVLSLSLAGILFGSGLIKKRCGSWPGYQPCVLTGFGFEPCRPLAPQFQD